MIVPGVPWLSLTSVARLASTATDVSGLACAVLEPLRHLGVPLAVRAPFHALGEGSVICAFSADLVDGHVRELVRAGLDGAMLAGLGDTGPTRIDAAKMRAAGPGVPEWAGTGLWLPNVEEDAAYAGLVVLARSPEVFGASLVAWLEVAASIVAVHAVRLVSTTPAAGDAFLSEAVVGPTAPDEAATARVKELQALHDAALILQAERTPIADLVQDLADRLPEAWRHSPDTSARLRVGDEVGTSPGFVETAWMMRERRALRDGTPVAIDVAYHHEHAHADEGPFLSEERSLIASLTQMLISYLDRRRGHELDARVNAALGRQVDRLAALQRIDAAIIATDDWSATLGVVLEQVADELGVDAAEVLLFDSGRASLEFAYGTGFWTDEVRSSSLSLGEGIAGQVVATGQPAFVEDIRTADPPFVRRSLLNREQFVSYVGLPLVAKGDERKGLLGLFHRSRLQPDRNWWDFATALSQQVAIAMDNRQLFAQLIDANDALQDAYDATIAGWARALDLKDEETAGHSARVTDTTVSLARRFGIVEPELNFVRWGALLHDIGKMGVPDRILRKPDKLTDEERAVVQRHTTHAYDLLAPIAFLHETIDIPYAHHERFDGHGYPRELAGEAIPLAARIFAIVDVFDALTSDRPYRPAWSRTDALEHVRAGSGRHFDPTVVDAFLDMIEDVGDAPPTA